MRFDVGLWDRLFGERVTLEVPTPDGRTIKRSVTKKWLEQMKAKRELRPIDAIRVHMLDPLKGYHVLDWIIGKDVPQESVEKFRDPGTDALYAMTWYEEGKAHIAVVRKDKWDDLRRDDLRRKVF